MAYREEWELHRRCAPQGGGKGPAMSVCPVHWRGRGVAAGFRPVWKLQLVSRKTIWSRREMRHLNQERKSVCRTRKGLSGNQRMSQDWPWAVSRLFCRE